jgi:DNA-binding NarL/FixJ family response regulator
MGVGAAGVEVRQIARYLLTRVLVLRGRLPEAAAVCDEAETESAETFAEINRSWIHGAVALLRWRLGHADDAVEMARNAAERTAELGQRVPAAFLWSDVADMGAPRAACAALSSLASGSDAPVVRLLSDRTEAVIAADVDSLLASAARAEAAGLRILGLSALHSALDLCAGRERGADTPILRVLEAMAGLRSRCRGLGDRRSVAHAALSPREVEVATLAALGSSDREIAESLIVSIRTVHAHLRSVYSKLGIGGRGDLAALGWLFADPRSNDAKPAG